MFFIILCLLLWALFAFNRVPDQFGWLMVVGFAWFAGFMDCRIAGRGANSPDRRLPPDMAGTDNPGLHDTGNAATFHG